MLSGVLKIRELLDYCRSGRLFLSVLVAMCAMLLPHEIPLVLLSLFTSVAVLREEQLFIFGLSILYPQYQEL